MYVGIGRCIVSITSQREGRVLPGYIAWANHFRSGVRQTAGGPKAGLLPLLFL